MSCHVKSNGTMSRPASRQNANRTREEERRPDCLLGVPTPATQPILDRVSVPSFPPPLFEQASAQSKGTTLGPNNNNNSNSNNDANQITHLADMRPETHDVRVYSTKMHVRMEPRLVGRNTPRSAHSSRAKVTTHSCAPAPVRAAKRLTWL